MLMTHILISSQWSPQKTILLQATQPHIWSILLEVRTLPIPRSLKDHHKKTSTRLTNLVETSLMRSNHLPKSWPGIQFLPRKMVLGTITVKTTLIKQTSIRSSTLFTTFRFPTLLVRSTHLTQMQSRSPKSQARRRHPNRLPSGNIWASQMSSRRASSSWDHLMSRRRARANRTCERTWPLRQILEKPVQGQTRCSSIKVAQWLYNLMAACHMMLRKDSRAILTSFDKTPQARSPVDLQAGGLCRQRLSTERSDTPRHSSSMDRSYQTRLKSTRTQLIILSQYLRIIKVHSTIRALKISFYR